MVEFPTLDTTQRAIWCARGAWNATTWTLFIINGNRFRFDYASNTGSSANIAVATSTKYTVTAASNQVVCASETQSGTHTYAKVDDFTCGGPLTLFYAYVDEPENNKANWANHRLYSFKVWRSDELIHYFVPCKDADGKATMVDICHNPATLTTEGTFAAGDEGHFFDDSYFLNTDSLLISSTPKHIGTPSPSGNVTDLALGATVAVSCGATPWTNTEETVVYCCTGWKLYDDDSNLISNGTDIAFTYTHPGVVCRLEWQWTVSEVKGTVTAYAGGSVSPSGAAWYSTNTPVTVTATPAAGNPFVFWTGILPLGIDANVASVTFTPSAPFEMTAIFTSDFYVATTGNDDNSGTKAAPFATIGAAVTAANAVIAGGLPSATVRVADGNYTLSGEISVAAPIAIVGESGNRDAVIVTAKASNRAFTLSNASATLSSITVLGGNSTQAGGNIYIDNNGGIVTNCVVANGHGVSGGNIAIGIPWGTTAAASSLVVDCVVSNGTDTAADGTWESAGNIFANAGRILRCVISDGYVQSAHGGGNVRFRGAAILENCLVTGGSCGNASASVGSGISVSLDLARVVNCTIVGNRPPDGTSKPAVRVGSTGPVVVNCVIYGNGSGGQDVENDYKSCFINCAFSSDGANCADTVSPVTNLTVAAFKNYARGDYRPAANGVLFNAGDTVAYTNYGAVSTTDLGGAARIGKNGIDIGCYKAASSTGLQIYVR